jgi:DNA-binding transcriptional regulator YiaG
MQVIHLGQKELAERWRMSEATLERWRRNPRKHAAVGKKKPTG